MGPMGSRLSKDPRRGHQQEEGRGQRKLQEEEGLVLNCGASLKAYSVFPLAEFNEPGKKLREKPLTKSMATQMSFF